MELHNNQWGENKGTWAFLVDPSIWNSRQKLIYLYFIEQFCFFLSGKFDIGPIRSAERKDVKSTEEKRESCQSYIKLYSEMECAEFSLAPLTNRAPTEVNRLEVKLGLIQILPL